MWSRRLSPWPVHHSLAPNGAIVVGRELVIVRILVLRRILEVVLRRVVGVVVLIAVVTVGILVPPAPVLTISVFLSVYLVLREGPFSSTWSSPIVRTPHN